MKQNTKNLILDFGIYCILTIPYLFIYNVDNIYIDIAVFVSCITISKCIAGLVYPRDKR